jgi:putative hydrolase of the HAD superfamily
VVGDAPRPLAAPRAVIIDMDDTLYPERDFLLSGARAVAQFLAERTETSADALMCDIDALLAEPEGRTQLFDRLLRRMNLWSAPLSLTLVHVYRTHRPSISACADVPAALAALRAAGLRLALISDGPATVQRNKFEALGLAASFDAVVFTDDLPAGHRKPSVVPFQVAANLLAVQPGECICIADDASKDFIAPRALGMNTICVRRRLPHPLQPSTDFPPGQLAHHTVDDLGAAARWVLSSASHFQESQP